MAIFWARVFRGFRVKNALPCVGLIVLGGCLTLIVTPDEQAPPTIPPTGGQPGLPSVVIDPGHGGKDEGTQWRGLAEKDLTLDVGLRLEKFLKQAGFPTVLTRRDDVFIPLSERVRLTNQYTDAIFVSIHFNSDPTGTTTGIQTHFAKHKDVADPDWAWIGFFAKQDPSVPDTSEDLAGAIETAVVTRTDARNRGIYANDFYVVHHTRCPAVLVEGGFISNAFEAQLLRNDAYRDRLAEGIAEGVMGYIKAHPRPAAPPVPQIAEAIR